MSRKPKYAEWDPWATADPDDFMVTGSTVNPDGSVTTHYRNRFARAKAKRERKTTFASVAKQAAKLGIEVARFEVDPNSGKIVIVPGKPEANTTNSNPWDEVLTHGRH